ncbi:MAG: hypothetical protein WCX12_03165 [Candidatus Paceibacterota bacterium]|jgi:hypothetical protein
MNFLKEHYEKILAILSVVLLVIVVAYFVWAVRVVANGFSIANNLNSGGGGSVSFDIEKAKRLQIEPRF